MTDREPSTSQPYEMKASDIAFEWFLAGMTPERALADLLPPPDTVERIRVEQLRYGREYQRQARLTQIHPDRKESA